MKFMKRGASACLAVVLAALLSLSGVFYMGAGESRAQEPSNESDFDFSGGVISGYSGSDAEVVIPSTIDGESVTSIDTYAFVMADDVTSVVIPETVTYLANQAFYACGSLSEVTFEGGIPLFAGEPIADCAESVTFHCQEQYKADLEEALNDAYWMPAFEWTIETFPNTGDSGEGGTGTNPQPTPSNDIQFEENGEGVTVTGYTGAGGAVEIPDQYNGKPVTAIADNAFDAMGATTETAGRLKITSVTMPDTIVSIGNSAFAKCLKMESIKLSGNLQSIGENAFQQCSSLTTVEIPASVASIGDLAFKMAMDSKLESIKVAEGNAVYKDIDGVLFTKDGKTLITYPHGRQAEEYQVPDGVEKIAADAFKADYAFSNTSKLKSVVYPESLKEIGDRAFMQTNLESITIYPNIKMGEYVYDGCSKLKTVTVAEGVTEITEGMFYGLDNCETVNLPSTLKTIGYRAFDRCGVTQVTLPEGLVSIGEEAFEHSKLTAVTIPKSVTELGARAFYGSADLASVDFAEGSKLTSIGEYAFNHCTGLKSVALPDSVETLEDGCFSYCFALREITLPNSVKVLEDCVFSGSRLTSIVLPDSITEIGSCTFRDCNFTDGGLTTVKMPAYLEKLGTCTFENCTYLTSVEFPETIKMTSMPVDTFFGCKSMQYVYMPAAIEKTEACSFANCEDSLVIEYGNKNLKRDIFDCYQVNPGEYYELRDDGFYWTTEELTDDDYSNGSYDKIEELAKEEGAIVRSDNGNSTIHARSASGTLATCGCGTIGGSVKLTPSCSPTFRYKGAGSSVNIGGNGSGAGWAGGNTGAASTTAGNGPVVSGKAVNTGDNDFADNYLMVMLAAAAVAAGCVAAGVYRKNKKA